MRWSERLRVLPPWAIAVLVLSAVGLAYLAALLLPRLAALLVWLRGAPVGPL